MVGQDGDAIGADGRGADKSRAAFLSHSSSDHELAQELCASLEARGVACWIAPRDIAPGQPWALGCLQGVANSRSLVLLASESALGSVQVLSEVEQAHKRAKPIYTVLIPPAKVRGEMDFYLSRLHWMQSGGRTADEIAKTLAAVMDQKQDWQQIASPPTLRRTMLYRPVAFAKLVGALVVALALLLGGVALALNRALNLDYRRLGYVDLAAEPVDNGNAILGHTRVWLMAKGVPFQNVRLTVSTDMKDGGVRQQQYATWAAPEQVGPGAEENLTIPLTINVQRVTTCLITPSPGLAALYRVTQHFMLTSESGGIRLSEIAEKSVSKEDGSPCRVQQ